MHHDELASWSKQMYMYHTVSRIAAVDEQACSHVESFLYS